MVDPDGDVAFIIVAAIVAYRTYSAYETAKDVKTFVSAFFDPFRTAVSF